MGAAGTTTEIRSATASAIRPESVPHLRLWFWIEVTGDLLRLTISMVVIHSECPACVVGYFRRSARRGDELNRFTVLGENLLIDCRMTLISYSRECQSVGWIYPTFCLSDVRNGGLGPKIVLVASRMSTHFTGLAFLAFLPIVFFAYHLITAL